MKIHRTHGHVAVLMLSLVAGLCGAAEPHSEGGLNLGLKINDEATPADVGLPSYPGSKPYKEGEQSSSAANLGFSTGSFGIKVIGMNFETRDKPERVATFYKRALSKYGNVLECTGDTDTRPTQRRADDEELVCEADDPGTNSVVYKVGTEKNQRIVAIKSSDGGTRFSLVHVDMRGKSKR